MVEQCDFVVAITHMRLAEDLQVSSATDSPGDEHHIDLLLGGHDHENVCRMSGDTDANPEIIRQGYNNHDIVSNGVAKEVNGMVKIVKSGTDWQGYSIVKLKIQNTNGDTKPRVESVQVNQIVDLKQLFTYHSIAPSLKILEILEEVRNRISDIVRQPLLHTKTFLDGRSSIIRGQETNLGSFLADIVRAFYNTQIAFVNSGGVRCNRIIESTCYDSSINDTRQKLNPLLMKDIIDIVPFDNPFVVKRIRGTSLMQALENSVSDAHTDGRFLQLSGLNIAVDWRQQEGRRILGAWLVSSDGVPPGQKPRRTPIDENSFYDIAMVSFIAEGFDGYTMFQDAETLIGEEGAMTDTSLMLQVFRHGNGSTSDTKLCSYDEDQISTDESINYRRDIRTEKQRRNGHSSVVDNENDDDDAARGIERARKTAIVGFHDSDGLPIVAPKPAIEWERISVVGSFANGKAC